MPDAGHLARRLSAAPGPDDRVVIVGASLAGMRSAETLRDRGFAGTITLIGTETEHPYDRPPLSKQLLSGAWEPNRIELRPAEDIVGKFDLDLRLGVTATALDLGSRVVATTAGDVAFDRLVIAAGTRVRRLPGTEGMPHVHVVRTLADSLRLRAQLSEGRRVVVIGAGFIGAEVAATAKGRGCDVTILEALATPLARQLGDVMGRACGDLHARNGVSLRTSVQIARIEADAVVLNDGERVPADVVVVGIGVSPNVEWLASSGVWVDDGVRCDDRCHALDAAGMPIDGVVAAGDIARWPNALFPALDDPAAPELMRVEHWTNAADMGAHAAGTIMGDDAPFAPVPYFWSDQYKHKIQFLGRSTGFDEVRVVDGDPADASWLALYRRGERLIGALGVSKVRGLMGYHKLLEGRASWADALVHAGAS